jgi:hypothetical protein
MYIEVSSMASFADHGALGDQQIDALKKIIKGRDATIAQMELQHRHDVMTMADISDLGERESQQIDALKTTIEGRDAAIAKLKQHHRHDLQDAAKAVAVLKAKGYNHIRDVPGVIKVRRASEKEKAETSRLRDANAELRNANDELQVVLADTSEKDAIIEKLRQDAQGTKLAGTKLAVREVLRLKRLVQTRDVTIADQTRRLRAEALSTSKRPQHGRKSTRESGPHLVCLGGC